MTRPTTHLLPPPGSLTTPCCDTSLASLPIKDRLVTVEKRGQVTCGKGRK